MSWPNNFGAGLQALCSPIALTVATATVAHGLPAAAAGVAGYSVRLDLLRAALCAAAEDVLARASTGGGQLAQQPGRMLLHPIFVYRIISIAT